MQTESGTSKKILVVLTNCSHPTSGGGSGGSEFNNNNAATATHRTGFDIREVAYIYQMLHKKHQYKLIFATLKGGEAPIDPTSMKEGERDHLVSDVIRDGELLRQFRDTEKLTDLLGSGGGHTGGGREMHKIEDIHACLIVGGWGCMFDLPQQPEVMSKLVTQIYCHNNGIIGTIGHGLAGLVCAKTTSTGGGSSELSHGSGECFLKGKKVTAATTEEDKEYGWDKEMPFTFEEKVRQVGGKFEKQEKFSPHVVVDDRLVTAQNPQSIKQWMEKLAETCEKHKKHNN